MNQNQNRHRPDLFADFQLWVVTRAGGFFSTEAAAMAGDWIKMRHDLADDPAVICIACATKMRTEAVVGLLHKFWSWADRHTTNGHAPGVTLLWVDEFLDCNGFAAELKKVSWLAEKNGGIVVPKFGNHMSKSAKNRALATRRQSRKRHATSVTKTPPEEKRREETSLDRSIDSNDRRKIDSIDWGEATTLANRLQGKVKAAWPGYRAGDKYREKFLTAAALVQCGLMPEGWLADAVDSMILKRRRSPAGYLGKVLADTNERWDVLQRAVTLPGKDGET